ncbi:MAG: ankyrin repeat domain-containing protein [Syntrophales bacterium]|nr:ankyrin repeat domain-containing protein [Syntrophales bacterium]MDD5232927.1 ankyrin repeat domain-containing protein [Syntrophales bacterium]MDD5531926.1 ankyrin repeat domain-containing protein [Syntrophales bacterium]
MSRKIQAWFPAVSLAAAGLMALLATAACAFGDRDQRMITAAGLGDAARVESLLKRGADVNARETGGQLTFMRYTALMRAAGKGHTAAVRVLLARGADIHAGDSEGRTALMMAAQGGHQAIAEMLVGAGANIHARSRQDDTALIAAARGGHEGTIRWLLKRRAAVNAANDLGETALMAAALRGHARAVEALLGGGARTEMIDEMGNTALILASTGVLYEGGGSAETVGVLLEHGADVNRSNDEGVTPLIGAAARGNIEVVRVLLAAGADREARIFFGRDRGETALSLAIRNKHTETARILQTPPPKADSRGRLKK